MERSLICGIKDLNTVTGPANVICNIQNVRNVAFN